MTECRSDASNMFDEEPGEDEIEYSDDEEEAEAKKKLKGRKNKNRSHASNGGSLLRRFSSSDLNRLSESASSWTRDEA